jgi:alpha-amylase/alpha-mannosidase (GH57 family)
MTPESYVCIHGHFYQPPRENPWLEAIELQDTAYPYHDWNARITAECYAPNAASRILDRQGRIYKISNNYARISFNFGPTLLAWLEVHDPDTYAAILDADRLSRDRFSGHGSAMAQAYNHMLMPLANRADKETQVHWGIRDFERRFGRPPAGMWLPETGVCIESLEVLAAAGINFTVLAPNQAARVRRLGDEKWSDVSRSDVDFRRPFVQRLPSGRSIVIFFYDGPTSRAVAFEGLLKDGERFAQRLVSRTEEGARPQLLHIATDGETYGHHHRHGDMALSYALEYIEQRGLGRLTNYGEFLARHAPAHEVQIAEETSWSCVHGVERWRSNCGCHTGGEPGWHQNWREPLRHALDWLRDTLAPRYEEAARELLRDPWAARNDFIEVILDRSPATVDAFLQRHAGRRLEGEDRVRALKLLELQRHALLMYTSCGWFFNELSGIETVQVIQYAGRAVQLAQELFGNGTEAEFLHRLEQAESNLPEVGNGRQIYERSVHPAMIDLVKVGGHYAVSSLFETYADRKRIYCYQVEPERREELDAGEAKLTVGRARFTSEITGESALLSFGAVHLGDHSLTGGVRPFRGKQAYDAMSAEVCRAFSRADFPNVIRLLDKHFHGSTFSLRNLFLDEQRKILNLILKSALEAIEDSYRVVYERHAPLMRYLEDLSIPLPRALSTAAEFILNTDLRRVLREETPDMDRAYALLEEAEAGGLPLDEELLSFTLEQSLERLARKLQAEPTNMVLLRKLQRACRLANTVPFEINLWKTQNIVYELRQSTYPGQAQRAAALAALAAAAASGAAAVTGAADGQETGAGPEETEPAREWVERFEALCAAVAVAVES